MSSEIDTDAIVQVKALMGDKFIGLVDTYVRTNSIHVENLRLALEDGDVEKIVSISHAMKSSAGHLGLVKLSETAKALELHGKDAIDQGTGVGGLGEQVALIEVLFKNGTQYLGTQIV